MKLGSLEKEALELFTSVRNLKSHSFSLETIKKVNFYNI